jgi:transposase-like protein
MSFSPQDKAQFVRIFIQEGDDYAKFQRRIRKERGRHAQIPPHNTLKRWMEKFEGDGQKRVKSPRTKTVRTPENIQAVKDLYTNDGLKCSSCHSLGFFPKWCYLRGLM